MNTGSDISGAAFSNSDAISTVTGRMIVSGGNYVILVRDGALVGYVNS